jgi:tetratricopeptide (TPR) repeat protein
MSLSAEAHRLADAGRHQAALAVCRTLINGDDNPVAQATAYCTRGMILWKDLDRLDDAIADFSRAMRLNQRDVNPLVWRAKCYEQSGQHSAAAGDWNEITRRSVGSQLLGEARDALERLGKSQREVVASDASAESGAVPQRTERNVQPHRRKWWQVWR